MLKLTSRLVVVLACVYSCETQVRYGNFMTEIRQAKHEHKEMQELSPDLTGDIQLAGQLLQQLRSKENTKSRAEGLLQAGLGAVGPYEVGDVCLNHTKLLLEGIVQNEDWALRMIDAMGKPGSDLLDLHIRWLGNWEECVAVEAVVYDDFANKTGPSNPYRGKYCLAYFPLGAATSVQLLQPTGLVLNIGACFPDTCNSQDAAALLYTLASLLPLNTTIPYPFMQCHERELEYSGKAIAVIVVCSVFLLIMLIATAYDIFIQHGLSSNMSKNKLQPSEHAYGTFKSNGHVANGNVANGNVANGHLPNGKVISDKTPLVLDMYDNSEVEHGRDATQKADIIDVHVRSKPVTYKPGLLGQMLLSFSVYTNAKKILNTSQSSGTLTSVNGIRFISMTWVILGHTYAFGIGVADNIVTFLPQMMKRFSFQAISNATVSVDTFFVLSGLLVAYLSLREMKKRHGVKRFNWGMFYFHRFWRLTPPYMLVIMVYVPTMRYWTDGPLWPQSTGFEVDECKDTWWKNLLYINNIVEPEKMCMGWSWYLANDMQFYILSPLMLVPLYYSPLWGSVSCLALALANFITTGVISKQHELGSNMILGDSSNESFALIYVKPWCRIAPYVVGIFTGYLLYVTDCKVKMSKFVNMIGWIIATTCALLVLYGLYTSDGTEKLGVDASALYNATSRAAWGMSVAWVIFACATGYGGPVNALLSWRAIIPLSRLTYCAYLIHPIVMFVYYFSRRTNMRWYDLELSYTFMGNLCITYAVAFIVSLAFESPMMGLEKAILGRRKRS